MAAMDHTSHILNIDIESGAKKFKKGTILQHQGEKNNLAFYVKSGLIRSYTIDKKGKEHIFMFGPEGWVVADIESQEFDQPTELFIDCLEDSEIVVFNREEIDMTDQGQQKLLEQVKLMSRRIGMLQRRVLLLMSTPAKERYQAFIMTYPDVPNRVPQRMIASYLGITPEALSKLRSELARSKD